MLKGVIFDLDGVVVDTAHYHYQAWKKLAGNLGFEFTEAQNEKLKGVSRMASLEIVLEIGKLTLTETEKKELADLKNTWYLDYISRMTPGEILPGVARFLDLLRKHDFRIALGTASRNASLILEKTGLTSFFDHIIDGNCVTHAKPDPEVFLAAALALDLPPTQCVVFEDAVAGVEAAHRAGMRCIGVGDPEILNAADKVIPGFEQAELSILTF